MMFITLKRCGKQVLPAAEAGFFAAFAAGDKERTKARRLERYVSISSENKL